MRVKKDHIYFISISFLNGTKPHALAREIGQLKTPYGSHFQNVAI